MKPLRVLAFGAWDHGAGYPRAGALLAGLRANGGVVSECRFELPWSGTAKRALLARPWAWPGYFWALRRARREALRALRSAIDTHTPDVVLVPYPGHLVVRWVREVFEGPVILDLFLSAYDTAVVDRQMFREGSVMAKFLRRMDRRACEAADRVLVDTPANAECVAELVELPRLRFVSVQVSDPDETEAVVGYVPPASGGPIELLFFGTGVPLHGLGCLLDAVAQVPEVRLTLLGGSAEDRVRARDIDNVAVADEFVGPEELRARIDAAHLIAGVFGTSAKADRVVPFKVMQALQAGRPVITGRTRAVSAVLRDGVDAILVPPGDVELLAAMLRRLVADPSPLPGLAGAARAAYEMRFSLACTGEVLAEACAALLGHRAEPEPELVGVP